MSRIVCVSDSSPVLLKQQIASSGEGEVWETNRQGLLAKVYHTPTTQRARKLEVMLQNPPNDPMKQFNHVSIVWPQDLLSDNKGQIVGFLMPMISNSRELQSVYNPKRRRALNLRFDWRYLHVSALNVAWAVQSIHEKGYVLGDIKPENILVNDRALISIIDTDSFQVRDPKTRAVFRCTVGSEGFTPPELIGKELSTITQTQEHDCFRLAVIIFQLLFGYHPFGVGQWTGKGEIPTQDALIERGVWIYGKHGLLLPAPTTIPIETLYPALKTLFLRCFNEGHSQPSKRPAASEWCTALRNAEQDLTTCIRVGTHLYSRSYGHCPWCDRALSVGFDIFNFTKPIKKTKPTTPRPKVYYAKDFDEIVAQENNEITVVGKVRNASYIPEKGAFLIDFGSTKTTPSSHQVFVVMIYAHGLRELERASLSLKQLNLLKGEFIAVNGLVTRHKNLDGSLAYEIVIRQAIQLRILTQAECEALLLIPPIPRTPNPVRSQVRTAQVPLQPRTNPTFASTTPKWNLAPAKRKVNWSQIQNLGIKIVGIGLIGGIGWYFLVSPYLRRMAMKEEVEALKGQLQSLVSELSNLHLENRIRTQKIKSLNTQSQNLETEINLPQTLLAKRTALERDRRYTALQLSQQADRSLAQVYSWCTVVRNRPYPCLGRVECAEPGRSSTLCDVWVKESDGYPARKYSWAEPLERYERKYLQLCQEGFSSRYCDSYELARSIETNAAKLADLDNQIITSESRVPTLEEQRQDIARQIERISKEYTETSQVIRVLQNRQKNIQSTIREYESQIAPGKQKK